MCPFVPLQYRFTEWTLRDDSRNPGDDMVHQFLHHLQATSTPFDGWIFRFDRHQDCFVYATSFAATTPDAARFVVAQALRKNAVCCIKLDGTQVLDMLLTGYATTASGHLVSNDDRRIFYAPIAWQSEMTLHGSEILLVVHHDGDPIVVVDVPPPSAS